jgi:hypothetical protein
VTLVIGTDEAGYGPNLGPLVVAATAWRVAATAEGCETAFAAAQAADVPWGDSKRVYRGGGMAALETGALVGLALAGGGRPADAAAVAAAFGNLGPDREPRSWAAIAVPHAAEPAEVERLEPRVGAALAERGIELLAIRCRVIAASEFNRALDGGLNKADLLSQSTLQLAAELRGQFAAEPAVVWCDRHGGRRRYAGLVARHFGEPLVSVIAETAARSAYEVPAAGCRIEFSVGGESRMPVALASMTAKYLRELAMVDFNAEWCRRVPGLAPTAGYPVDALRWRNAAAAAVDRAGVPWDDLWRRA